ncbi:MAG: hypothetical protein QOC80_2774, partial [Frankiaceae bacterium]|nr:hypothetical protein [Frankiaceae bacterium]
RVLGELSPDVATFVTFAPPLTSGCAVRSCRRASLQVGDTGFEPVTPAV